VLEGNVSKTEESLRFMLQGQAPVAACGFVICFLRSSFGMLHSSCTKLKRKQGKTRKAKFNEL